ncbi:MAG: hypothetical protein I3273_04005 [Candidatus Moeniiplasma glomeromycotorum]|nr:hypothetical protein [Candidatus Moeniiplasma glomeromycotorum]
MIVFWENSVNEEIKEFNQIIIKAVRNYENLNKMLNISWVNKEKIKERQEKFLIIIGKCVISQLKYSKEK